MEQGMIKIMAGVTITFYIGVVYGIIVKTNNFEGWVSLLGLLFGLAVAIVGYIVSKKLKVF